MENIGINDDAVKIFGYEVWALPERSFGSKLSRIRILNRILKIIAIHILFDLLVKPMTFFYQTDKDLQ